MTEKNNTTLTLNRPLNPLAEFIKDFQSDFFNFSPFIDFEKEIPVLRNTLIDRTGFPRANVKNISTVDEEKLLFELALPGWNKENSDLDITIDKGILKIVGKITQGEITEEKPGKNYGKEYEHNISSKETFMWSHSVTEDTEFESATLKDGLLRIIVKIPQPNKPKLKSITVG